MVVIAFRAVFSFARTVKTCCFALTLSAGFSLAPAVHAQEVTMQDELRHLVKVCVEVITNPTLHLRSIDATEVGYFRAKAQKRHAIYRKRENRKTRSIAASRDKRAHGDSCALYVDQIRYAEGIALLHALKSVLKKDGYKESPLPRNLNYKLYHKYTLALYKRGKTEFILSAAHKARSGASRGETVLKFREVVLLK